MFPATTGIVTSELFNRICEVRVAIFAATTGSVFGKGAVTSVPIIKSLVSFVCFKYCHPVPSCVFPPVQFGSGFKFGVNTIYVPIPPFPVPYPEIYVPLGIPVPVIFCPIYNVPELTLVTVRVFPLINPVTLAVIDAANVFTVLIVFVVVFTSLALNVEIFPVENCSIE